MYLLETHVIMKSGAPHHEFDDNDLSHFSPISTFFLKANGDALVKAGITVLVPIIVCLLIWVTPLQAAQLVIPEIEGDPGEIIHIPIILKDIDNLAGLKLTISFDRTLLTYQNAIKSPHASGLMHLVNASSPGRLTIVMAGAAGISSRNIPVLTMIFKIHNDIHKLTRTELTIGESQLMSETLQEISHTLDSRPIIIHGEA